MLVFFPTLRGFAHKKKKKDVWCDRVKNNCNCGQLESFIMHPSQAGCVSCIFSRNIEDIVHKNSQLTPAVNIYNLPLKCLKDSFSIQYVHKTKTGHVLF